MKRGTEFLESVKAVVEGHFVFKSGFMHGNLYVNKEAFSFIGAKNLIQIIKEMVDNAIANGLSFGGKKEIGIIGPAYGAIPFALTVAGFLEEYFPEIKFFPARTELKRVGNRDVHYLPDKLAKSYHGKIFIGVEDVVNNGTTIREVKSVFAEQASAEIIAFLCFVNRAKQNTKTLRVNKFYPLMDLVLKQYDIQNCACPLCTAGIPINTELGKGSKWVEKFGQPPYPNNMDFSSFWD